MKNLKISMKLMVSFGIVVVLAIAVGLVGIYGMSSINAADDRLYKMNVLAISAMADFRETYQQERTQLRAMIIAVGDDSAVQSAVNEFAAMEKKIADSMNAYEATIENEADESAYYEAKKAYLGPYYTAKQGMFEAALAGDAALAIQRMKDAAAVVEPIVKGLQQSASLNNGWASDSVDNNTSLFNTMTIIQVSVLVFAVGMAAFFAFHISNLISKPLGTLTAFMNKAGSTGDIILGREEQESIKTFGRNRDEVGQCITSTADFVRHITTISDELEAVAGGDLNVEVNLLSDRDTMGISVKKMVDNLNNMFSEISQSTEQVSTGSKQIADGSQTLAQGSTEQAAAVEQLSSSISEIAQKTKENAEMATKAANLASTIKQNAEKGNRQMGEMMEAVKEINQASQSINKVIKVIDDIAFQTNILALNAAVEAARAGQHGKGFAVVAEEVRNLAAKSAEAAKDTGGLIANSMEKAEMGARIAGETATSLADIVTGINESNQIVGEIAKSSEEQSLGISQINKGIDQVAQVIQQNSATAEESAAASEEMSGQANMLEDLISQFKLKEGGRPPLSSSSASSKRQLTMPAKPTYLPSGNKDDFGKY